MDNWITQILLLVASFVLGIVVNLITPSIANFFKKSSLTRRERKIKKIKDEYERIKLYRENHSTLTAESIRLVARGMVDFILLFVIVSLSIFSGFRNEFKGSFIDNHSYLIGLFGGYIMGEFNGILRLYYEIGRFESLKEETIKKLKKLGATLDEEPELESNPASGG